MGKRMKKVCTDSQGTIHRPSPGVSSTRPSRPLLRCWAVSATSRRGASTVPRVLFRSEEHTSELQSLRQLVWRLLLGKKKENVPSRYIFSSTVPAWRWPSPPVVLPIGSWPCPAFFLTWPGPPQLHVFSY